MHVAQHVFDGVVGLDTGVVEAAILTLIDVDRIGVAKQVVHVAENFLVGPYQEHPEEVLLSRLDLMHRHAVFDALLIHVMLDLAVGVAGQILQHGAAHRFLTQALQRNDR